VRWLRGQTLRRTKVRGSSLFVLFCLTMHVGSEYNVSQSLPTVELGAWGTSSFTPQRVVRHVPWRSSHFRCQGYQSQAEKPRAEYIPDLRVQMHSDTDSVKYKGTSAGRREFISLKACTETRSLDRRVAASGADSTKSPESSLKPFMPQALRSSSGISP
jgi:hypothetical protein